MQTAEIIVEELLRLGIEQFYLSPGSRSTPLVMAIAERGVKTQMHYDERGAAFAALGYAKAMGRPAVLVCTSGSAVANYFPAIVEASQARVPMLVITADRPPELQDVGANQTINQTEIFGSHVRWFATLATAEAQMPIETILSALDDAVHHAITEAGPVHLNAPFREPFFTSSQTVVPKAWQESQQPYLRHESPSIEFENKALAQRFNNAYRPVIVAGQMNVIDAEEVLFFAKAFDIPVLPEVSSGLRLKDFPQSLAYYDTMLNDADHPLHKTDLILYLGERLVSKRLLTWMEAPNASIVQVLGHAERREATCSLEARYQIEISTCLKGLAEKLTDAKFEKDWTKALRGDNQRIEELLEKNLNTSEITEPAVARQVSKMVLPKTGLYVGNSMPIRDLQRFAACKDGDIRIGVNRGASGIDGTIASAAGFAKGIGQPVTVLLGDLAALHDLNSLPLARAENPLIIIIINNQGGGIFSFLPIKEDGGEHFEPFFATPHEVEFSAAAKMFGLDYNAPETMEDLQSVYQDACQKKSATIIEVSTERNANYQRHQELDKKLTS